MLNQGVGSWAARRARRTPERVAVIHGGQQVSYAGLDGRVTRLAHALRGLGVARGDRVAYLGPNHPSFLEALLAAGMIGAVFVPLNTRLAATEVGHCLTDSAARTLINGPSSAALVARLRPRLAARDLIALAAPADGEHDYQALLTAAPPDPLDEPVGLDDPFMLRGRYGDTRGG